MRALSKIRQTINPPYSGKDLLTIFGILTILLAVPLTVSLSLQRSSFKAKALTEYIDTSEVAPTFVYASASGSTSISFDAVIYQEGIICSSGQTASSTGYLADPGSGITFPGLTKQTTGVYSGWYRVSMSFTCQNLGGQNLLYAKKTQTVQTSSSTPVGTYTIDGEFPYSTGPTDSVGFVLYVGGKPDLAITSFSLSNINPSSGATVTANVTAKNIGDVPLLPQGMGWQPIFVRVYRNPSVTPPSLSTPNDAQAGASSGNSFPPGTQQTFSLNFTAPATPGSYTAWALASMAIDVYDPTPPEKDAPTYNNNYAQVAYSVGSTCTNDCSSVGAKQCSGNGYQTCGYVGSCLKWSAATPCPPGQTCSGGVCSTSGGGISGGATSGGNKPVGVTGSSGGTGSGKLENLTLEISVPYLVGTIKTKVEIGSFQKEIEVNNNTKQYQLDVKDANLTLKKAQTITLKSDKTLIRKVTFTPTAIQTTVSLGDLILGDINQDNSVDSTDQISLINSLKSQTLQGDLNDDKITNSFDWAILLTNFGKKGD